MIEIYDALINSLSNDPFGQGMGIVAFVITMYAFWLCKDKQFIFVMMGASLFWGFHFALIWALAAAWVQLFDIVKNSLALKYEKSLKISLFLVVCYLVIGFFTYKDSYSLLPILTSVVSIFLVFYVRGVWLNIGYLWIIVCWFGYNLHNWSIGWMLSDVVLFFVWIAWIIRILITDKKDKWKQ